MLGNLVVPPGSLLIAPTPHGMQRLRSGAALLATADTDSTPAHLPQAATGVAPFVAGYVDLAHNLTAWQRHVMVTRLYGEVDHTWGFTVGAPDSHFIAVKPADLGVAQRIVWSELRVRPRRVHYVPGTKVMLLSRPTKMPGPSWSLPAGPACPFRLDGPNAICSACYAERGKYGADPDVKNAQRARFNWTRECLKTAEGTAEFVRTMVTALRDSGYAYIRVHDSGDLFSAAYTRAWISIAQSTPELRYWFATRSWRAPWVDVIRELALLPNVTVRPSALHFGDAPPEIPGLHAGTTAVAEGFSCPASAQRNACGPCRACWDRKDTAISYHAHFTKVAS